MTPSTNIVALGGLTLGEAAQAFLGRRDLGADTLRSHAQTLRRLRRQLGDSVPLRQITPHQTAAVFTDAWDGAAPRTWNRHRSALSSFTTWAADRGWVTPDLAALINRRPETHDRTRAIDRHIVTAILDRRDVALRDKTLRRPAWIHQPPTGGDHLRAGGTGRRERAAPNARLGARAALSDVGR